MSVVCNKSNDNYQSLTLTYLKTPTHTHVLESDKGKGEGMDTCYSATYTSQTRDQQRFIIS